MITFSFQPLFIPRFKGAPREIFPRATEAGYPTQTEKLIQNNAILFASLLALFSGGHPRSLAYLRPRFANIMQESNLPDRFNTCVKVIQGGSFPKELTDEIVTAAIRGRPLSRTEKLGTLTVDQAVEVGLLLNDLAKDKIIPVVSPFLLHAWAHNAMSIQLFPRLVRNCIEVSDNLPVAFEKRVLSLFALLLLQSEDPPRTINGLLSRNNLRPLVTKSFADIKLPRVAENAMHFPEILTPITKFPDLTRDDLKEHAPPGKVSFLWFGETQPGFDAMIFDRRDEKLPVLIGLEMKHQCATTLPSALPKEDIVAKFDHFSRDVGLLIRLKFFVFAEMILFILSRMQRNN